MQASTKRDFLQNAVHSGCNTTSTRNIAGWINIHTVALNELSYLHQPDIITAIAVPVASIHVIMRLLLGDLYALLSIPLREC